jgi:hypothetical protein
VELLQESIMHTETLSRIGVAVLAGAAFVVLAVTDRPDAREAEATVAAAATGTALAAAPRATAAPR